MQLSHLVKKLRILPKPALSKLYFAAVQQNANRKQVVINVALRVKNDARISDDIHQISYKYSMLHQC